jgi:uncharacterized alkaline shock family protein YloU
MKMSIFDRILLTLYTLFGILLSLVLLGVALNILHTDLWSDAGFGWPSLILSAVAVVLFLVSVRLLVVGFSKKKPVSALLTNTDLGVIRVSINTLDTLTQKAVRSFQEVKDIKSVVLSDAEGIRVQLKISVLPDVAMPELSGNIQAKVKEYVEALSGITVKEVQVYIESLSIAKQTRVD